MIANGTAAYGMYSRNTALPEVVCALNKAGFSSQDICMVLSPAHPDAVPRSIGAQRTARACRARALTSSDLCAETPAT